MQVKEKGFECSSCGHNADVNDLLYCSRACFESKCYWTLYADKVLMVEDECNGCGSAIIGDVKVKLRGICP